MGGKVGAFFHAKAEAIKKDHNFSRVGYGAKAGVSIVRAGAGHYFASKVPVVSWLPMYVPMWLIGDIQAGVAVGFIIFPQVVIFSSLSGVTIQDMLISCWLPGIVSAVMGTSRDMTVGPLLYPSIAVYTIIAAFGDAGPSPALIAATISLGVGIWSFLLGMLNLGFVFNSLSVPVVLGFTCAIGIIDYMGFFPQLFGLTNVSPILMEFTSEFIANIKNTVGAAFGLGAGCIVLLVVLQMLHTRFGKRSVALRIALESRNMIVLVASTGVGYVVNNSRDTPLWPQVGSISGSVKTEAAVVQGMTGSLFLSLFLASLSVFIIIAFQHIIVAKGMARTGGYTVDCSQELVHLGITNMANAIVGGYPVGGGDMTRASINRASGVRSPLSGLVVSAVVSSGLYIMSGFMDYLPMPAAAAVVVVSVINAMPSPSGMMVYWKSSFVDFITFLGTFNMGMIMGPMTGIEIGGGVLAVYTLFRHIAMRPRTVDRVDLEARYSPQVLPQPWDANETIPRGMWVMTLKSDLMCANAHGFQKKVIDTITTMHAGTELPVDRYERIWSDRRDKRIRRLRRLANVRDDERFLPRLRCVVFDMTAVSFIDGSGLHALEDIKSTLRAYGAVPGVNDDAAVEFRYVGLSPAVRKRFSRAEWPLVCPYDESEAAAAETLAAASTPPTAEKSTPDYIFDHLPHAIRWPLQRPGVSPSLAPLAWSNSNGGGSNTDVSTYTKYPPSRDESQDPRYNGEERMMGHEYLNGGYSPIALREMI